MGLSFAHIDNFISEANQATDLEAIIKILRKYIILLGFERFTYWLMWQPEGTRGNIWLTSYPQDWIDYYIDQNFRSVDLVARYSATQVKPYVWSDVQRRYELTDEQKIVFGEGAMAGLRAGASVPIHGPGAAKAMFSVANDEPEEVFQKLFLNRRHQIHLLATYAHEKIIDLGLQKPLSTNLRLTARELEVLTWTARGKTRDEISDVLMVSSETVKKHLEHVCSKLGAVNKTHATAIALINRLILPYPP